MENCEKCGAPMEEGHVCATEAPAEETAPESTETVEEAAPEAPPEE
jgi:hypothetical protein